MSRQTEFRSRISQLDGLRAVRCGVFVVVLLLVGLLGVVSVGPSRVAVAATGEITSQKYVGVTGLDRLKAEGFDGSGVTIAVIDGPIDLSVPELAGADVTVAPSCDKRKRPKADVEHGTAVLSLLANKNYGWAPKARYLTYTVSFRDDKGLDEDCKDQIDPGYYFNEAINDGADIISMSGVGDDGLEEAYALARAALKGIPVVVGTGNDGSDLIMKTPGMNGVIAVGATDLKGKRADYSNWGFGLTLEAPGGPITMRMVDAKGKLTKFDKKAEGTSFSTPMVSGALALAMQKWPDANGNQLIRSMIDTAVPTFTEDKWGDLGHGNLDAVALVNNDPSGFETSNPLADKYGEGGEGIMPTKQMFEDYLAGLVDPIWVFNDHDYVYRGTDPEILAALPEGMKAEPGTVPGGEVSPSVEPSSSPTATPSVAPVDSSDDGFPVLGFVVGGVGLVLIAVVVVFLLKRSKGQHAS